MSILTDLLKLNKDWSPNYIVRNEPAAHKPSYRPSKHMARWRSTKAYADGRQKAKPKPMRKRK